MFPKRYAECKVDGNEVLCHSDRVLLAMSEYESELASLRQKQVLWEAGNRELADRLEARDVAIDALRAEKERAEREAANVSYAHACEVTLRERAEAERDEAIRMRDRHAEASKAQNEDITALMAERDAALKDAERYRFLCEGDYQDDGEMWTAISNTSIKDEWDAEIDAAIDAARKEER